MIVMPNNNNPILSCACNDGHSRMLWWNKHKMWLIFDTNKPVIHNGEVVGMGDWTICPDKETPIIRRSFIFR
jgi:hypothetical protein